MIFLASVSCSGSNGRPLAVGVDALGRLALAGACCVLCSGRRRCLTPSPLGTLLEAECVVPWDGRGAGLGSGWARDVF